MKLKTGIVFLTVFIMLTLCGAVSAGTPLEQSQNGTVSGDLYVNVSCPWPATTGTQSNTLPDYTSIQSAKVYVNSYAVAYSTYGINQTTEIDANGDGDYNDAGENLGSELLNCTFDTTNDPTVYIHNDHVTHCYSDYQTTYDVTNLISSNNVNIKVTNTALDGYSFDGRIKMIALVVAYNDGDSDKVDYWVLNGQDWTPGGGSSSTSTFNTTSVQTGFTNATLNTVACSSSDGTYSFNNNPVTGNLTTGSYYKMHNWDVTSYVTAGTNSDLTYTPGSGSFKMNLATLAVREAGSTPAPVAAFTASTTSGNSPLTVQFNDTSTGNPTTWAWDFDNDGVTDSTDQNPSHTYTTAGTYTVKLTASNPYGSDDEVKNNYITVTKAAAVPVAAFTATPTSGPGPLTVSFTDQSTDTTGWAWDFNNDGITDSTDTNSTWTYTTAGNFTVKLTVTGPGGVDDEVKADYITVNPSVDLSIDGVNSVPSTVVFARESNPVMVTNVKNLGTDTATNILVALYASDVSETVPVATTIISLAGGAQTTLTLVDPTIRNLEGGTVTYTAKVDPDNLIAETNESNNSKDSSAVPVTYNGYKGKRYWDGGSDITTQNVYDIRGDVVYYTQPSTSYMGVGWTSRTETWTANNLPIPSTATVVKALLYVAYNWDQTPGGLPNWIATFNYGPINITPGTPYIDMSNFGGYCDYEYGLYSVDVTSLFRPNSTNTFSLTSNQGNRQALYPSTLVVIYSDPNSTRKQIFINEECDELLLSSSYGTTLEEATAYAPFTGMTIDTSNVKTATLHSFAGSAGANEGNLLWNGVTIATNAWQGNSATASALVTDVKPYLNTTDNIAGIQGTTSGGMDALQQILVVEYNEPAPVADFTGTPTNGTAPLQVQYNDTSTGYITNWAWDFNNDGTTDSTEQNPSYIYNHAGTYTVKLTTTGPGGSDEETKTNYITVNEITPVADFTGTPTSGAAPLIVTFTDQSTNAPNSWLWDFNNDGITDSTVQNPIYTYSTPGTYTVKLTVSNSAGSDDEIKTNYINATATPPIADFIAAPTSGYVPLTVQFTDQSTSATGWAWDFQNDGIVDSTVQNPSYTYNNAGTYTVKLTATNDGGTDVEEKTSYITVNNRPYGLADTDWPKFGLNSNNTGQSIYNGPSTNNILWTYTTGGSIQYSPVIGLDGTIYTGNYGDNKIYAINPDGTLKWTYTTGGQIRGSPTISADGTIYTGNYGDNKIYAINPDGSLKWTYTTGGKITGSVSIGSDGTIYIGSNDGKLYAMNPDGTPKWTYTTGGAIYCCPAIGTDGTIYTGSMDKKIYAINSDGTLKWAYNIGYDIYASPSIATDGTIYIPDMNPTGHKLYALNPNGTLKWTYTAGNSIYSTPTIGTDGTIYIGSTDSKLYAINPNGTLKWTYTTGGAIRGSATIGSDGTIYIGNYGDTKVYAINPNGTLKWTYTTGGAIYIGYPVIGSDGTLYVGSMNNKLYAFKDPAPVANFTANTTNGAAPLQVQFTDTSSNYPTTWLWDFGDGTTSTEQNPTHTYSTPGTYTVSLTASNSAGEDTLTETDYITVNIPDMLVTDVDPAEGAGDVNQDQQITVTFNQDIQAGSNYNGITVQNAATGQGYSITKNISGNQLTINGKWTPGTTFQIVIPKNSIQGIYSNQIAAAYTSNFTASSGPSVTSFDPIDGSTNVKSEKEITVTFSDDIQVGSNYNGITVRNAATGQGYKITKTINGNTLSISGNWTPGVSFEIVIPKNAVRDLDGNGNANSYTSNFTAGNTFSLVSFNPTDGSNDVDQDKQIVVTFSEDIQAGSNYQGITVKNAATGQGYKITKTITGNTLTITGNWTPGTTFQIVIPKNSVKDLNGNQIINTYTSNFTTSSGPSVTSFNPADGTTGVARNQEITITFSDDVQAGNNYNAITVRNATTGQGYKITKTITGNTLTITGNWTPGTTFEIVIPRNAVKDANGNANANSYTSTFTAGSSYL